MKTTWILNNLLSRGAWLTTRLPLKQQQRLNLTYLIKIWKQDGIDFDRKYLFPSISSNALFSLSPSRFFLFLWGSEKTNARCNMCSRLSLRVLLTSEVKQHLARRVLWWEAAWELLLLRAWVRELMLPTESVLSSSPYIASFGGILAEWSKAKHCWRGMSPNLIIPSLPSRPELLISFHSAALGCLWVYYGLQL